MVNQTPGGGTPTDAERLSQTSDEAKSGWERAVQDMRAMAADREEKEFSTVTIAAGDTSPVAPEMGDTDEFGLSYIIPGNTVEEFEEAYLGNDFTETGVYQTSSAGHVYIVTECIDVNAEEIVFIAGVYQKRHAAPLVRAATERGTMFTRVKTLDHTEVGVFEHDDVAAFFPNPDEFYAYEVDR
ncbi:hypothetical protein LPA44_03705 [Halobacterium sp. KA-4]|uniref:DUF7529 family protein n=1 Tax=Halobacterium sp. KA-4 TaxID=2896367 RepID=UPI001E35CE53|nr:hypothetical protein [Halobacterium sp. KA-4]MCD2199004.1 hypothetical protein [Halobacterium sp. KA-4]